MDDPFTITLLNFHDVYALFVCCGHIVLADIIIHLSCNTVVESLKSLSWKTELKNSTFSDSVRIYKSLQILMENFISDCFGMMTFHLILLITLQMSPKIVWFDETIDILEFWIIVVLLDKRDLFWIEILASLNKHG